jgi:hypothetical protein
MEDLYPKVMSPAMPFIDVPACRGVWPLAWALEIKEAAVCNRRLFLAGGFKPPLLEVTRHLLV